MKNKSLRTMLIIVILAVTAYYLTPLFLGSQLPKWWTQRRLKLGLDLQGGMQILLNVDTSKLVQDERENAVNTALEVIRNRIDQFGVAEPSIQRVGDNRIIIQLPGLKDFGRAKNIIGQTALLEFKLLADGEDYKKTIDKLNAHFHANIDQYPRLKALAEKSEGSLDILEAEADSIEVDLYNDAFDILTTANGMEGFVAKENIILFKELLANPTIKSIIPSGIQISLGKDDLDKPKAPRPYYMLYDKAEITGKYLKSARVAIGQGYDPKTAGKAYIGFKFNKRGSKIFADLTGKNIKKRLAIILDNSVYMAPTIQDKIRGGEGQITGIGTMQEAQDLVIVLKAGNLPAPVNIIEERTVGPTLGSDSISAGKYAGLLGLILVALFMMVYYKLSGLIANVAVAVNMGIILAALTMLRGTLTMPGIAGIILTIGMAVDANVLIFERIREEIRTGKATRPSVNAGFSRAMVTILDANITTLITAIVLYQFGTGAIRGFAVTLSIGIIASMFTSIILVKAIFDAAIINKNRKSISI